MRIVRSVAARLRAVARVPAVKPLGAILVVLSVWCGLAVGPAAAQSTSLFGTSSATYDTQGRSFTNADGFLLSGNDTGTTYRAVVAFNVPAGSATISQAVFRLPNSNNTSGNPVTELRSVSTPPGYAAIGNGALVASAVTVQRNLTTAFALNASGLAAVNALAASGGGTFYVGLKLSDESVAGTSRYYSIAGPGAYELILTRPTPVAAAVPTMSEWAMILFGMLLACLAALYIQRRRMTA